MVLEKRKSLAPARFQNPDCPTCSLISYPGSRVMKCDGQKWEKKFSKNPFRAKQCNCNINKS
jgi:hypothetical protein